MRTGVVKAVLGGFLFFGASWGAMAGCSSDDLAATPPSAAAKFCPNTLKEAVGLACSSEGLDCPIGYQCLSVPQQGHCVCTAGKFACTDATKAVVPKGAEPACINQDKGNDQQCPASVAAAGGKTCTTAGLLCYYAGPTCPESNGVPKRDQCQCKGANPLTFVCETEVCNPSSDAAPAPVKDSGTTPKDTGTSG